MTQDPKDSINTAVKKLIITDYFYGLLALPVSKELTTDVPVAAVCKDKTGFKLLINPNIFPKLRIEERVAIIKHELLHIGYGHLLMNKRYPDHDIANLAMDLEINQYIDEKDFPCGTMSKEDFLAKYEPIRKKALDDLKNGIITKDEAEDIINSIPPRPVLLKDYLDIFSPTDVRKGTKFYYDALKKAKDENSSPSLSKTLSEMDQAASNSKQSDSNGTNDPNDDLANKNTTGSNIKHNWKEFDELTEIENKLMSETIHQILKNAAEETLKQKGSVPGEFKVLIESLDAHEPPRVNWEKFIRNFIGKSTKTITKKTRRKQSKRYPDSPGIKTKRLTHVLYAIDVSASVSNEELADQIKELRYIYKKGGQVTIIECDTKIQKIYEYKGETELKVHGRGGTKFQPVIDYYEENLDKYSCLIYFTDGECYKPKVKNERSIAWLISKDAYDPADHLPGLVINLNPKFSKF